MKRTRSAWNLAAVAAAVGALGVGCAPPPPVDATTGVRPIQVDEIKFDAEAGLEPTIVTGDDANMVKVASRYDFGRRGDPFHMLMAECDFDSDQLAERVVADAGGFVSFYATPDPGAGAEAAEVVEPLPLWRLSGVILTDGVCALLDMGGRTIPIRPGMKIDGTDWTVVSINADSAVLKRSGKSPSKFVVPLQGRLSGAPAGGGNTGGGNNQGGQAGGRMGAGGEPGARDGDF
ncbi:MAG: hypothetical protein AB7F50_03745 [Fimbriimonadaceae bacterium]